MFGGSSRRNKTGTQDVFRFDSASEESDDEKMLEERLKQFERVQFVKGMASDLDDNDEDEEEEDDDEMFNMVDRPTRNKYGGDVDERDFELIEGDGKDQPSTAVLEEMEAKQIQKRLASMISDTDISLELLGVPTANVKDATKPQDDKTPLSTNVDLRFPEIEPMLSRLNEEVKKLNTIWIPLAKLVNNKENKSLVEKLGRPAVMFIKSKHLVTFTYCLNALFYLRLRSQNEIVEGHPVTARLVSSHKLLEQLETVEEFMLKPKKRLSCLLEAMEKGASAEKLETIAERQFEQKASRVRRAIPEEDVEDEMEGVEDINEPTEGVDETEQKRSLTNQMENPSQINGPKSKDKRNPRVANRKRFDKALRRRRASGVREWKPPVNAYGGEITGIRAGVRRSTKLKN